MTRLYDRNFAFAMASQTCFVVANTLMAHYAVWIEFLGGDSRDIGWITGVAPVLGLLVRPWIGQWIDRAGTRATWALGEVLFLFSSLGNLYLGDIGWQIYFLRTISVVGVALVFASSLTFITQNFPSERRAEAIGTFGSAGFIGMLIGPFLGDLILGGPNRSRDDFVLLFGLCSATIILSLLFLCFVRPSTTNKNSRSIRIGDFFRIVRAHWPGMILLVNVMFGFCMTLPFAFLADFVDEKQLNEHLPELFPGVSLFFFAYAGWGIFLRLVFRRVPDRIGREKVLIVGMMMLAAGAVSFLLVDGQHPWRILIPGLICGTGHALVFHTMTALATTSFPSDVSGIGSTLSLIHLDIGWICGAPILGLLAHYQSYESAFILVGTSSILVTLIYFWSIRESVCSRK